jgi:DNA-binding response OmpR family regulator
MIMLVVDDLAVNRASLKEIFRSQYEVLEAADGMEALEILKQNRVDIVILDVFMPNMDGTEVLRQMRMHEEWQKIPVLIKTAVDENMEVKLLEMGADDFIFSPFDPAIIVNRVKNIMQKYIYEQKILPEQLERELADSVAGILEIASAYENGGTAEDVSGNAMEQIRIQAEKIQSALMHLNKKKEKNPQIDTGVENGTEQETEKAALIVSEDKVYGDYLANALVRCGVASTVAGNVEQASREWKIAYNRGGYDLCFLDFSMEEKALAAVCRMIQEMYEGRSGTLAGIVDSEEETALAERMGVVRLLKKPVLQKDIKKLLKEISHG